MCCRYETNESGDHRHGNIGTDLLIKVSRSEYLECGIFAGRNADSEGSEGKVTGGLIPQPIPSAP
jgi:hypothetical protein